MPFNVPDDQKPTFNKEVKSSLELLAGGIDQTLGQWEMLQPETLVEEYQKPIQTQVVERLTPLEEEVYRPIQAGAPAAEGEVISAEPIRQDSVSLQPEQERVEPIVREYQAPMREDIMSVSPYQQAVADATSAQVDSLRNEAGELPKSAVEVFSKPFNENSIKALGMVDSDGNPTEKGELFYNLSEAGMFDQSGVLTEKGQAYLTPINELGKPENLKAFQTLWDDKVIRPSASFGEITENTAKFLGDIVVGGAEGVGLGAESLWRNGQTWSSLLGKTDNRPQPLRDKLTASNLGLVEGTVENLTNLLGMADVGAAWIGEKLYDVLPVGMEKEAEQAMYEARQRQWQTQQEIENLNIGDISETVIGIDGAIKEADDAKGRMGVTEFTERYKRGKAFSQVTTDVTNLVPAAFAVKGARMAPLANRLSITAQKRMGQVLAQDLAIAQGRTAIETANSVLKKEAATVGIANRLGADIASRAGANPELVARANQASQVASRITQSAEQIRLALPSVTEELEKLVAKRNSLATRIPESYAQKMLQTMEVGRQARSMPAKAIGATLERIGNALSKTDDAVTNFLKDRGFDQMYTAAVGAAGVAGMAGSPIIGAVAAGAAALKTGKVLSSYGKLFRYVGKEMENVRGQIPFWKRVASHTAPNSLGRGIAHSFNMLDLGGVTSDVLRRTGRGIAAAAPTDLMFEYLSDGADMRPETLYQAAAESLVIGGSFAAAGGAFMGTKKRMRELSIGDELNFKRDLVDPRQKALFEAIPSGTRSAIATYSIANPTLNYQFKDSGASQYDPNTNTATINVKSTNPIKALVAHETLHHTIIKNNMESGISALFLGDMKENTVGGLFRSRDGKLDPNFEAFKDAYYNRLGVAEMSNAERDAIYPLDKVAVEYFIEKHSDQYSAMAESGELGAIASSGAAKRKLGSILETILPRVPVLRDLHFKSGGMIDKNGSWVTGNGILDAEGIKTDPITNKMFRDMNRRSAGLATGQFEPLISDKADSGASIILNPSDSIDSELLHPLVKTDENGKPILENGRAVALDKATEMERALAGLTVNEVLRRKRSENYAPEKGEAYIDDNNQFQSGWLPDDVVSEMFAKNRFNPEQKRIIREMNRLVRKGTGDRVVMINFPATTRNKSGKAVYKPQGATLRDTVPVAILTSKDGNLLFGLMSVTKLQENIQKRSQSARGKRLYSGNVDLILRDTQAMMDFHKNGVDSIEYFSDKYGAVEADQRKKFINTMFGLLNQKEQAVLNPMLLEDGVKSKDNVYRTYRADRVSKAVPMSPQDYPAMPFSYKATSQVLLPEQARQMPEQVTSVPESEGGQLKPATWSSLEEVGYNPSASEKTQITTTAATYEKIVNANAKEGMKVLDFSAGLGAGTASMKRIGKAKGFEVAGYEPYSNPQKRVVAPEYEGIDSLAKIPNNSQDIIINNAVLNVVPGDVGRGIVRDIYSKLAPEGSAFINVMGWNNIKGRLDNPKTKLVGPREVVTQKGTFQKGYTTETLRALIQSELPNAKIVRTSYGDIGFKVTKPMTETKSEQRNFLPEPMKKPYGPNDPLPKFESTVVKGETKLKGFKWDKATNVVYDIGNKKTMSFSYDPAYLIEPKFGNPEKLLKGQPVIMLEADKARATGGDMGGVNFPNLRSNQVTVTGPDGIEYRVKWANMTSTFVSGSKNRMQSHGAKYALIQLMDDFALKSNKRTARTLDQAMRDAALTADQNNMIAMAMNYGIIVGKKSKLSSTATALKRALSDATVAEKEIINKKIKSTLAERDALNPSPDEMEVFKSISNVKTAMSNLATGRWKQSTVDNAFSNFQALKDTDAFKRILSRITSPYVYDNVGNTFTDRGAAVGSITSVKIGDFNVEKIMRDSSDFKEAKNLDIVSAVELSQNPDFFALYFGKDPLQEAEMSANERSARDKMLADNDFQVHESYDWAMIGPAEGGDFIFDKPVRPEEIFKKYRAVHEKASVKDGSEETVAGAMRKSAEYKLTAYGDTVKMTGEEKPTKAKKTK